MLADLDTRNALIQAAKGLFAKNGYDGTSVKQICESADVNISLVSYHFQGKEGLYRACLEQFAKSRLESAHRLLAPPKNEMEFRLRLELFVEDFITVHLDEPELTSIVHREVTYQHSLLAQDIFQNYFLRGFQAFVHFVESAQERGFVRKELDPTTSASFLLGGIIHMVQSDACCSKYMLRTLRDSDTKQKAVEHFSSIFLKGVESGVKSSA